MAGRDVGPAADRRVNGRPVGARDVDAEVERVAAAAYARVAEERAYRVLAVERLDRPAVGGLWRHGTGCRFGREDRRAGEDCGCGGAGEPPAPGAAADGKCMWSSHAATLEVVPNRAATAGSRVG